MGTRWPVHPPPLPDETLSSWLLRNARANASSLSSWLAALEGQYGDATSLDTTDDVPFWTRLAEGSGLAGGATAVRALTFVGVEERLHAHAANRWLLSVSDRVSRPKHGFCVGCLAADQTPYLRRAWRMEWVRWCPIHACRLAWSCRCNATLSPWRRPWDRLFTSCWYCERDIVKNAPRSDASLAKAPAFVMEATRQALALALDETGGTTALDSPFPAVWCLQKWAEAVERESWPSWIEKLEIGEAPDASPPEEEDAVAWSFALAWHLATGPQQRLADLVSRHQATFNRATETHCPPSLRALRRSVRTWHKVTVDDVERAVAALVDGDMAVTYLAVAEALGVSPNRITDNDELRAAVDRVGPVVLARWCAAMRAKLTASRDRLRRKSARLSRANLATDARVSLEAITRFERETGETFAVSPREDYEKLVGGAIVALRERGERITTVAVARELGRERSFIEKNPDLKQMVHAARTAKPTVEEVRRACGEVRARDEVITIVAVAEALGRGREVIERAEALRAIVDAEREADQQRMEERIRAARSAIHARGKVASMAGVCRELGLHRSYIEKRGRLWELVNAWWL